MVNLPIRLEYRWHCREFSPGLNPSSTRQTVSLGQSGQCDNNHSRFQTQPFTINEHCDGTEHATVAGVAFVVFGKGRLPVCPDTLVRTSFQRRGPCGEL